MKKKTKAQIFKERKEQALLRYTIKLKSDPRSTAAYWNGDDWGSISGFNDAEKWMKRKIKAFTTKYSRRIKNLKKKASHVNHQRTVP